MTHYPAGGLSVQGPVSIAGAARSDNRVIWSATYPGGPRGNPGTVGRGESARPLVCREPDDESGTLAGGRGSTALKGEGAAELFRQGVNELHAQGVAGLQGESRR